MIPCIYLFILPRTAPDPGHSKVSYLWSSLSMIAGNRALTSFIPHGSKPFKNRTQNKKENIKNKIKTKQTNRVGCECRRVVSECI